jgi:multiple sugar transport system substrate-binding protein
MVRLSFDTAPAGRYKEADLLDPGSARRKESTMSARVDRRQFLTTTAAAAGLGWLASGRAPALAQKRELTFLSWNHFVPASDDELRRQAEAFGREAGVAVRVDTIAHLQLPAKYAAEAQARSGHDMFINGLANPFLYERVLADVGDVVDELGKKYGGWYPFSAESALTKSGWRAVPWFWISFPATYNRAHFKRAGVEPPRTWAELAGVGKALKKLGHPVGIPVSHCADAHATYWSVAWCFGAKVLEADGVTPAINSDRTAQVIEWYKELYRDAMEPEVLSWDDASNNRFILSGKGSWIHNPISPYTSAVAAGMPIADDLDHHQSPGGPAGIHSAPPILGLGIWSFSRNIPLAKDFIRFLFRKENYDAWIVASGAFNHPPLRSFADHPIWARNPKLAMLPKEAEFAHPRGWPAKPSDAVQRIDNSYVMADMVAKAINGMPTRRAMEWAHEQVVQAVKGQLRAA